MTYKYKEQQACESSSTPFFLLGGFGGSEVLSGGSRQFLLGKQCPNQVSILVDALCYLDTLQWYDSPFAAMMLNFLQLRVVFVSRSNRPPTLMSRVLKRNISFRSAAVVDPRAGCSPPMCKTRELSIRYWQAARDTNCW